jgi:hypothetical protein
MSNPKADEYLWDAKHSDWSTCEVCNEEFAPDDYRSRRCTECEEEYGDIGWPDRF